MGFQVSPGVNITEIDLTGIVPAVSTTEAGIAGVFRWGPADVANLVSTEVELVDTYFKPDSSNFETFLTAANFLAYGNKLYVVRTVAAEAKNAVVLQNSSTTANADNSTHSVVVKNQEAYENDITKPSAAAFIAKYPGSLGNALKISICDSANAFESTVSNTSLGGANLVAEITQGNTNLVITAKNHVGSSSAAVTVSQAQAVLTDLNNTKDLIGVNDLIVVGNSSIGTQELRVVAVEADKANSDISAENVDIGDTASTRITVSANVTVASKYTLGTTAHMNLESSTGMKRRWEYFRNFDAKRGTSLFANNVANNQNANDELHIVVTDEDGTISGVKGTILETYNALSRATNAKNESGETLYFETVLNDQSKWVFTGGTTVRPGSDLDTSGDTYVNTAVEISGVSNTVPFSRSFEVGRDGGTAQNQQKFIIAGEPGAAEGNVALSVLTGGYDKFKNAEEIDISIILQGKARGASTSSSHQLGNYIIDNICEPRKDCIAIISPEKSYIINNAGDEAANTVDFRNNMTSSSYGILDGGYKYQYDRYNDVYRYVPYAGDVAGLIVRTDTNRDPWYSPAGFNRGIIKNVIKNYYNPDKADRDILYKNGINPIVTFPGQGTILFGDKTLLAKPSAFDRINVRRLFIVLEKAIATAAKYLLFEFNDEFTRAQFRNMVEPFLRDVQGRRGIFDFRVVCDETNNTGEVIDRNEFIGDIYIKPARSINFIQLNFVAVRTNVDFSEVVGQF